MVVRILIAAVVCIALIYVLFWLLTGGFQRAVSASQGLLNPIALITGGASGTPFRLPWQPDLENMGSPIPDSTDGGTVSAAPEQNSAQDPNAQLQDLQQQYNDLNTKLQQSKTFGNPSPYVGRITFTSQNAAATSPNEEYVTATAVDGAGEISLQGWSIQSAVSGARYPLPPAAPIYMAGMLNKVQSVSISGGQSITITSGTSPVGVSFRENACSGYLAQFQDFTPTLSTDCPDPSMSLPTTAENIRMYGGDCIDYVASVPACTFPDTRSSTVSPGCKAFVGSTLSYNGCVNTYRGDANFYNGSWRLYLGSAQELWQNPHDIIRLLDEKGQTVDVITY